MLFLGLTVSREAESFFQHNVVVVWIFGSYLHKKIYFHKNSFPFYVFDF